MFSLKTRFEFEKTEYRKEGVYLKPFQWADRLRLTNVCAIKPPMPGNAKTDMKTCWVDVEDIWVNIVGRKRPPAESDNLLAVVFKPIRKCHESENGQLVHIISKQLCLKRLTEYFRSLASRHLLQPDFLRSHVCGFFVSQSLISKTGVLKMIVFFFFSFFSNFFIPEILDEWTDAGQTMFWRILGKFLN